jgi:hypothetical protein
MLDEFGAIVFDFAVDVVGLIDPTPFTDTVGALRALAAGRWFDAAASGIAAAVPFVGDLAKAGKLPRYLRALERAIELAERTGQSALLLPGVKRLVEALNWLPTSCNPFLAEALALGRRFVQQYGGRIPRRLPDISRRFQYTVEHTPNFHRRIARGRLGHPEKILQHKAGTAHAISRGTGEHASHMIGKRFGGPDEPKNLSLQNLRMNSGHDWKRTEDYWERQLRAGVGIEVEVIDVYRAGATRPFARHANWTEIHADGRRVRKSMGADVGNWDSRSRRAAEHKKSLHTNSPGDKP